MLSHLKSRFVRCLAPSFLRGGGRGNPVWNGWVGLADSYSVLLCLEGRGLQGRNGIPPEDGGTGGCSLHPQARDPEARMLSS